MSPTSLSHDAHSDDDDENRDRDRQLLPSFAQAFPSSPTLSRPQLRNALSDSSAPSSSAMPAAAESQKRKRDEDSLSIKHEDNDDDSKLLPEESSAPTKKQRSGKGSTSPQPLHSKPSASRSKHTLSGHPLLNDSSRPIPGSSNLTQTLPTTVSFADRRAASNSRKGAPSSLSISSVQTSKRAKELGLEPIIRSAPPVPASRLRLHQLPTHPPAFHHTTVGGVPSISRVRFGATYETSPPSSRIPQPPKTASIMGSSSHTSGGGGIQTILQPPTPSTAGLQPKRDQNPIPLVPPTPSTLRHALSQINPSRQSNVTSTTISSSSEGRLTGSNRQSSPKQAFLQPFEAFYDALADAKSLKEWLSDQLHRATVLVQQQQQQVAGGSVNVKMVEEIVDQRMRGYRVEVDQLRERVSVLEDALVRNGISVPPVGPVGSSTSFSRTNGNTLQRSPGNLRERDLPPPVSANNLRDPFASSQLKRPSSLSPSAQQMILPPASNLTKLTTSSSRLDPLPPRAHNPSVTRGGRIPSPLSGSPISEGEERRENRKNHDDREEKMDTT